MGNGKTSIERDFKGNVKNIDESREAVWQAVSVTEAAWGKGEAAGTLMRSENKPCNNGRGGGEAVAASPKDPKEIQDEIIAQLKQVAVPLLAPYARRICLFGSIARGDFDEDSDIDLLIELKDYDSRPPLTLVDLASIQLELSQLLGRWVDLVTKLKSRIRARIEPELINLWREEG